MKLGVAIACLVTVAAADAQRAGSKPDFSGTWEMDATRSDSANSSAATGPVTLSIQQGPAEVTIATTQSGQTETLVYKLDGTSTERPAQDNGAFQWKGEWEGNKLVTETHRNINRTTVTVREVRSLDPQQKTMQVDRMLMVQHGYTMRGAQNYANGKDIFLKKAKGDQSKAGTKSTGK